MHTFENIQKQKNIILLIRFSVRCIYHPKDPYIHHILTGDFIEYNTFVLKKII